MRHNANLNQYDRFLETTCARLKSTLVQFIFILLSRIRFVGLTVTESNSS
jgi:hypothetical protein